MSGEIEIAGIKITQSDWNATPKSVKAVVTILSERLGHIEEQIKQNSQNSSRPPSSDDWKKPKKSKSKKAKKLKQKSSSSDSSGNRRRIYPIEECQEVHYHIPEWCKHCGEKLSGEDKKPYRHQIIDIPPISA